LNTTRITTCTQTLTNVQCKINNWINNNKLRYS
jgi:hypothetical protein